MHKRECCTPDDGQEHGPVLVRQALAQSLNIPAVKTLDFVGLPAMLDTAHRLGIVSLNRPDYGLSLTKVRFRDYFFGTGLGIIVSIFVITFLSGTLKDVWVSGMWKNLLSFEVFFAVIIFIFSLFVPMILKRVRGERSNSKTERSLSRK